MKKRSSQEVRDLFLSHFEKGLAGTLAGGKALPHARVESGPLVPANDPTLMFAAAGMVQFKDLFTGKETRSYQRATTSQKCIRISGKHNDLENVGFTARHHTFFEMLGNFSFGDYFKEDAIKLAWSFFTEVLELSKSHLVVTVFGGEDGVPADDEAARMWIDIVKVPAERVIRLGMKDNFWAAGDTGPCGPCSEIHYFAGDGEPDLKLFGVEPGADGRGWVELWNLVFMQFERKDDGKLIPLPRPSIDTGAGLERMTAVCQNVVSNYDTDLLRPIVNLASEISGKRYGGTLEPDDVSMRVIADHARTAAFLISEGIFPDKEARSYVLRRVMRRAIRHGHRLGIENLFFHTCADKVVEIMGAVYPQLVERRALIVDVCKQEEERFRRTMRKGLELLESNRDWSTVDGKKTLPGHVAFQLTDTFGFPLDLQEVIGLEQGFAIDHAGYQKELEIAREKSAGSKVGEAAVAAAYQELARTLPATKFVGYDHETATGKVLAILQDGVRIDRAGVGASVEFVVDCTPFYAESGGQVGDVGVAKSTHGTMRIKDTQKPAGTVFVHQSIVESGHLSVGDPVELVVDHATRGSTRRNHSATHLLHWALNTVVGPSAVQKGSLVSAERLRFDYSASKALTLDELRRIEDLVNEKILANADISTDVLSMAEAKARGAMGLFEEKYGDVVRVLTMTQDSIELCGGTHASRTGDIGFFKILSEGGVAAGVRRIEAVTGKGARVWVQDFERQTEAAAQLLKGNASQIKDKVERLLRDNKELQKTVQELQKQLIAGSSKDLTSNAKKIGEITYLGAVVDVADPKAMRELADQLRDKLAPSVVMLGAVAKDGKVSLSCAVSKDLTAQHKAGDLIKKAAGFIGGSGGGRPDFAQAGGTDAAGLEQAVASVYPA